MKREADRSLFERIVQTQSASFDQWRMFARIIRELKAIGATYYVKDQNIYAYRDKDYTMAVVAHMDTVHEIVRGYQVFEANNKYFAYDMDTMSATGIGGDDKVGIFIALSMLKSFPNVGVAFFVDEEVGCLGSGVADMTFFDQCNIILQADRKGNKDFVTSISGVSLSSSDFQKDVKKVLRAYGYATCSGMLTDVYTLKTKGFKGSVANVSCGYYNPHCSDEYIDFDDVCNTLELFSDIRYYTNGKSYPMFYKAHNKNKVWDKLGKTAAKKSDSLVNLDGWDSADEDDTFYKKPKYKRDYSKEYKDWADIESLGYGDKS